MKYALVTGGSRGIGRAICVKLFQMGYEVLINYVSNDAAAKETLDLIEGHGELLRFDVSDPAAVQEAISGWQAAHPSEYIEVLVNNAGVRKDNLLIWLEPAEWSKVIDTNLNSWYYVTRALLQPMLLKKFGRIINVASLSGLKGLPGQTNYSAAKGGLNAFTKALARELAPSHIPVNAICCGYIDTSMNDHLSEEEKAAVLEQIPAGRFGTTEDIAKTVVQLLEATDYLTGQLITVDGGWT